MDVFAISVAAVDLSLCTGLCGNPFVLSHFQMQFLQKEKFFFFYFMA